MKPVPLNLKLFLVLALVSLLVMSLDGLGSLNLPKSAIQAVTIPVEFGLYKSFTLFVKQFEFLLVARQAYLENRALKQQLGELLAENSGLRSKVAETATLVDQYNKLNPTTYDLLPARIIGSERYLLLDRGSDDQLKSGQAVVYKDSFVGQIKEVSPKVSHVLLPFDPDSKIAVFSQGTDGRAKGILVGQFGSEFLMDKILHQENIRVGDFVYSEGTEGRLPRGLIMGKVTEVFERQNEVFKQAKVTPIFDVSDLDVVFVLRSS